MPFKRKQKNNGGAYGDANNTVEYPAGHRAVEDITVSGSADESTSSEEDSKVVESEVDDGESNPLVSGGKKDNKKKLKEIDFECRNFKVERTKIRNPHTGEFTSSFSNVIFKDKSLSDIVTSYGIATSFYEKKFLSFKSIVPLHQLLMRYDSMVSQYQYSQDSFKQLMDWLAKEVIRFRKESRQLHKSGLVTWESIWLLFDVGSSIFAKVFDDQLLGSKIDSRDFSGIASFHITCTSYKTSGTGFFPHVHTHTLMPFDGVRPIASLSVQPMTKKIKKILTKRGKIFAHVGLKHKYMKYEGYLLDKNGWGPQLVKADGRIMVDVRTFRRMNPSNQDFKDPSNADDLLNPNPEYLDPNDNRARQMKKIDESQYHLTWPTLAGFSFSVKRWGEIMVANISEIEFDDQAFDTLVLPHKSKDLIKALVNQHQTSQESSTKADIITGKGGGKIFLLHGPPGTGKTLTAEAIAEHLHQPLYSISVGELGITAKELEQNLHQILEVAAIWNAVILIDEADIFLEQRRGTEVTRNAMVGIFLRLLEYHQGVLFMTTNRVKVFDEAFHSRISVALSYKNLDLESRCAVWKNFVTLAGSPNLDISGVAKRDMNGRQIRNVVTLACALASSEKKKLKVSHIKRTMENAFTFEEDVGLLG